MRHARLALASSFGVLLLALACEAPREDVNKVVEVPDPPEIAQTEDQKIIRSTERNVRTWDDLRRQGRTQQMQAVRGVIGRSVDEHWELFRDTALEADTIVVRNMAVKCIPFAQEKRTEARDTLLILCKDADTTIVANAVLGFGILLDKSTDLTPIVSLLASGKIEIRTNAATALMYLFLVKETPRELTPQYYTAIDRLVTIMHDPASSRSRIAAVWALANMRHPETLDHLVAALKDDAQEVQIGGLRGLKMLGDQRALEPLLEYLDDAPTTAASSWTVQALEAIAMQGGFAKSHAELKDLGTSARAWRNWFRDRRMR